MKAIDQKLEYPHCVYNDEGEAKVVNSLEEHKELEIHPVHKGVWMPNALRRKSGKPKEEITIAQEESEEQSEEITKEQADEIVDAQVEAKPRRGRRSAK